MTTIVSHVKLSSRKRSRAQFEYDIDREIIAIGNVDQPRKKRKCITSVILSQQNKKRGYSQTEFSQSHDHDRVLKERSPNKKIKLHKTQCSSRMMVDSDEEIQTKMKAENVHSSLLISLLRGAPRRDKQKFPSNRIRRSGLQFCVECGIDTMF